jgi:SAM-dependent methyltransferase
MLTIATRRGGGGGTRGAVARARGGGTGATVGDRGRRLDPAGRGGGSIAPVPAARTARPGGRPVGTATRGTTGANRLRRLDRWLAGPRAGLLRRAPDPLVVDLGHGASPVTTLELVRRLRAVRPDVEVVGLEIDPARVAVARAAAAGAPVAGVAGVPVRFALGGFELGPLAHEGRRPVLVRAANVLRQYPEGRVAASWAEVVGRLAPGGLLVDATSDELGRRAAWLAVVAGPDGAPATASLTVSVRLAGLGRPGEVAERLPKALIHRNTPGEPVHAWLAALDAAWERSAAVGAFGARQRWVAACAAVTAAGWPVLDGAARWRLGEVTLAWPPGGTAGAAAPARPYQEP